MRNDIFGQQILTETDVCNFYLSNPDKNLKSILTEDVISFSEDLEIQHIPTILKYTEEKINLHDWDTLQQSKWLIPTEYENLDIAKYVLDQCKDSAELQRAGEELLIYQNRNLFPLLRYLKYLVDTMRTNNIVWGVGRGSSVASFVLYLIGIHRINSLYYDLSIDEFLKE